MSARTRGQGPNSGTSFLGKASGIMGGLHPRQRVFLYAVLAAIVVLVILPQLPFIDSYWTGILSRMLIFAIFAMSLDLLLGYTGLPSLGHAAFFGTGAYTTALFYKDVLCPDRGDCVAIVGNFWFALLLGIAFSGVIAAAFGVLALRTRGAYFIMITLALAQMVWAISWGWRSKTNGDDGLSVLFQPGAGLPSSFNAEAFFYVVLGFFVASTAIMYLLVRSPFGQALQGIRESETRMQVLGYNVWLYKYLAFIISGIFAGVSGSLFVYLNNFVSPLDINILPSAEAFLMVVLGGPGTLFGPALGAGAIVFLENFLSDYTDRWLLILGSIYVLVVLFAPKGIFGVARSQWLRKIFRDTLGTKKPVPAAKDRDGSVGQ
jgi:branched-chain amino acid transport system permease protein